MTYNVSGCVEIVWEHTIGEKELKWCNVLDLTIFDLSGDWFSEYLFGLAKTPTVDSLCAERGVPLDCSEYVNRIVDDNNRYISEHGEGDFGHTYALWQEMLPYVEEMTRRDPMSGWILVFSIIEKFTENKFKPGWIRFVVWGNW